MPQNFRSDATLACQTDAMLATMGVYLDHGHFIITQRQALRLIKGDRGYASLPACGREAICRLGEARVIVARTPHHGQLVWSARY